VKNLYMLDVDDCITLRNKVEKVKIHDVVQLCHRILAHLHHGTLKITTNNH